MGNLLLWIENLGVTLLLLATLLAVFARARRRWIGTTVFALLAVVGVGVYAYLGGVLWVDRISPSLGAGLAALAAAFAAGAIWIAVAGLRHGEAGLPGVRAAQWPRGKLAIALAVAVALHAMTLWNLDLSIGQRLEPLRAEATALAMSVVPTPPADRDNAALVYDQAFSAIADEAFWPKDEKGVYKWQALNGEKAAKFDFKNAELRQFLQKNAGVLALLRDGADKPACYFNRDYGRPDPGMPLPELAVAQPAARLLALDARAKAANGDLPGALQDCRAILKMAPQIASEPLLIGDLVAEAIDGIAAETLEDILAAATPSRDDLAAINIDCGFSYHKCYQRALRYEEAMALDMFYEVATSSDSGPACDDAFGEGAWLRNFAFIYRVFLLPGDLAIYRGIVRHAQQLAARPYARREDWQQFETAGREGIVPRMLWPTVAKCAISEERGDARRRVMAAGVAAYRYQAARNRLPERLEDLVPEFLPLAPQDPFDGKPLRMKKTGQGLVIYSVGPNGVDNDGARLDAKLGIAGPDDIPFKVRGR